MELELRIRVPEEQPVSPAWFRMAEGAFRTLPTMLQGSGARSTVVARLEGHTAVFAVHCPPSQTWWGRLRRRSQLLLQPSALLDSLSDMQRSLRQAYADLSRTERDLRRVLELLPDPVAVCVGARILSSNREWQQAFGDAATLEEVIGRNPTWPGEGLELSLRGRVYVAAPPTGVRYQGQLASILVLRDVTEVRQEGDRLRVADRLSSLGTLAAGVGHEINNPLGYALGTLELLAEDLHAIPEGDLPARLEEDLPRALDGLRRVAVIARDLRTFSREGKDGDEAVDLRDTLQSALRIASAELRVVADVHIDLPDLPQVTGNSARLGQVFLNLLVNAAHAMAQAPREDHTLTLTGDVSAGKVVVAIRDTGCGMDDEVRAHLFEPFFTTKGAGGTGLGLPVCRRILDEHGGTLQVDSTVGEGTTIRVSLPIRPPPTADPPTEDLPRPELRLVWVDDEPWLGPLVAQLLRPHIVTVFQDPVEARGWLLTHDQEVDLLLCDVMMPRLSGPELVAGLPPDLQRRVLFVTGGSADPVLRQQLVGTPVLYKPFSKDELLRAVYRAHQSCTTG